MGKGDARVSDSTPLYSVGTWDTDLQAYTPQIGVGRSINVTLAELRQRVRELRNLGYSVHRRRDADGTYDDNDVYVLIERTDGNPEADILEGWKQ
jgi:hypothetical protein